MIMNAVSIGGAFHINVEKTLNSFGGIFHGIGGGVGIVPFVLIGCSVVRVQQNLRDLTTGTVCI